MRSVAVASGVVALLTLCLAHAASSRVVTADVPYATYDGNEGFTSTSKTGTAPYDTAGMRHRIAFLVVLVLTARGSGESRT